ncbi:MAG TPA: universal stress protein [Cytophagales bacterium]|nr:universal stress protein [Cytophagales bacterium]HAA18984.1 universal stress protein [Cytophagales bacterium]HAP64797.1 universal stress protein [Cytophagales bacterium]
MYPFRNVLIGLDLSDLDHTLLKFAERIYHSEVTENLYFVNVLRNFDVPDSVLKEYPDMIGNAMRERQDKMRQTLEEAFGEEIDTNKVHLVVKEGGIAKAVLNASVEYDIDVVILGRRQQGEDNGGFLAQRMARRAACSLAIIPEGSKPVLNRLLVPSDFSEFATMALEQAVDMARRRPEEVEVIVQNVYTIPTGYHYSGKTRDEFAEVVKENAKREYQAWIKEIDVTGVNIRDVYSLDQNDNPVTDIYDMAHEVQADAIIFGAKGRNSTTAFFIGSIAERVIQIDSEFPLLVVRPKGKNAGILDIIKEI